MAINERTGPAIVIAGSGMCTAGRIKHHLKHNLWREGASIVIVGFQAQGTTGRRIVDGAKQIKIFREDVAVRAKVFTIGGLSAHADQDDLLDWIGHFESKPRVFVIHGEAKASEILATKIQAHYDLAAHVPKWRERLVLKVREVAFEEAAPDEARPDPKRLALNTVVDLEKALKDLSKRIQSKEGELGEDELDRLAYLREEMQAILSKE